MKITRLCLQEISVVSRSDLGFFFSSKIVVFAHHFIFFSEEIGKLCHQFRLVAAQVFV